MPLSHAADDYCIRLDDPDAVQFRVIDSPQHWVLRHMLAAVAPAHRGRLPAAAGAVADAIENHATGLASLASAGGPGGYYLHCAVPLAPVTDVTVAEQASCIRELPEEMLEAEVRYRHDGTLPAQWRPAVSDPRRWYDAVADASLATWRALRPMLETASRMFDNEARRVGEALVRGAACELLNSLHPRLAFHDGSLHLSGSRHSSGSFSLDHRVVALVPMFAGPDAVCVDFAGREVVEIGYPAPGSARLRMRGADRACIDLLEQVLGPARARALCAARRPITAGALAAVIHYAPNTVSYHCDHLERLGLVVRDRRGAHVWISRTARGDELVDALAGHGSAYSK